MNLGRVHTAAAAAAALLLIAVIVHVPAIVAAMESVPDYVSPLVLAHDAHLYPGSRIVLGNYGWYPGFWGARALGGLPLGEHLAAFAPLALTILVTGLVAAQARRVWGAAAAIAVFALSLSMGSAAWIAAASWSAHGTTWWAMAVAGVTVVAAASGRRRAALAGAVATVAWGGLCLSGDRLVLAVVVAPLVAAAIAAAARGARGLALQCVAGIVLLGISGAVFGAVHDAANLEQHVYPFDSVPYDQLGAYAGFALSGSVDVWRYFGTRVVSGTTAYLAVAVVIGAVGAAPVVLRGTRDLARTVWTAFWTAGALGVVGAFVINVTSQVGGAPVDRYLFGLPLAAGAVLAAVVGSGRARRVAPAAVGVVCLGTAISFFTSPPIRGPQEHGPVRDHVLAAARSLGLTRGYASYSTAYAMERALRFKLQLIPVGICPPPGLCPFYLHRIDDAYRPQPGVRTFILLDRSPLAVPNDRNWLTVEPEGAKPIKRIEMGDGLEMLVYDHDVARELGPLPGLDQ